MKPDSLPTEVFVTHPPEHLGQIKLDWVPQPGNYISVAGRTYAILERHHHYQYKIGGYHLQKISVYVQPAQKPRETSFIDGHWVVGDASCHFNARSEILRCAVNPAGPCADCRLYEARSLSTADWSESSSS